MLTETLQDGLDAYRIGPKIRGLRLEKRLALSELGAHSGLSPGMLSKIERGQVFPTLPTLLRIAMVFGVGLDHFFRADEERPMFEITRGPDRLSLPDRPDGDAAYRFESLDFAADRRGFAGFVAEFPAGGDASKPHEHPGEELVFVIEGALEITAHGRAHRLDAGDAVHFDAGFDHSYRGLGTTPTRALVVTSRPPGARG
jgi:transcriptional regulator with XRE-family HTH domain